MANTPISYLKFAGKSYKIKDDSALHKSLGYTANEKNYPVQDSDGKLYVNVPWTDTNTTYSNATTSIAGLMSTSDKSKLDGIDNNANNYSHPTYTSKSSGLYKITVDGTGHVSGATTVEKSDITSLGIPGQDTTYGAATTTVAGLMSSADKSKLDGIANNANNYTYTLPTASSSTKGGILLGYSTSDKNYAVQLDSNGKAYVNVPWTDTNTTYGTATTTTAGLMSSADKTKLDNISGQVEDLIDQSETISVAINGQSKTVATALNIFNDKIKDLNGQSETISVTINELDDRIGEVENNATTSKDGLMSSVDKSKLDGIANNANNYSHPTYTSYSSGFYKITVDGTGHVSKTTPVTKADITDLGISSGQNTTYSAGWGLSLSGTSFSLKNATSSERGGICVTNVVSTRNNINSTNGNTSGRNYGVQINDDDEAFVNVPWTDTTYGAATTTAAGLMSSADKTKLNNMPNSVISQTINKTWSELKTLRDNSNLIPGQWYRITDYVTTTTQTDTQSANHAFDVIVRADSINVLNENAYAAIHSGDTYFANCKINAWELKYTIDNDTTKFAWADSTNGKGVIYYMKDEWENECPYDFKNIQFKPYGDIYSGYSGVYTFTFYDENNTMLEASTKAQNIGDLDSYFYGVNKNVIHLCHMSTYLWDMYEDSRLSLPFICFISTYDSGFNGIYGNVFGAECANITFGNSSNGNTFGSYCLYNSFGNYFQYNSFGNSCWYNSFGNSCQHITFAKDYCYYNIVENGNQYITLSSTQTTSSSNHLQNITIAQGVNNTTTEKTISHDTVNDTFKTTYQSANSQIINV